MKSRMYFVVVAAMLIAGCKPTDVTSNETGNSEVSASSEPVEVIAFSSSLIGKT